MKWQWTKKVEPDVDDVDVDVVDDVEDVVKSEPEELYDVWVRTRWGDELTGSGWPMKHIDQVQTSLANGTGVCIPINKSSPATLTLVRIQDIQLIRFSDHVPDDTEVGCEER